MLFRSVSRATLYNHYADRRGLLRAVLEPAFARALERVEALLRAPEGPDLDGVCDLCRELWEGHLVRFGLLDPAADDELLGELQVRHRRFAERFSELFVALGRRVALRLGDGRATGRLVYRCFVPMLESVAALPDGPEAFRAMLGCLILAPPASRGAGTRPRGTAARSRRA